MFKKNEVFNAPLALTGRDSLTREAGREAFARQAIV